MLQESVVKNMIIQFSLASCCPPKVPYITIAEFHLFYFSIFCNYVSIPPLGYYDIDSEVRAIIDCTIARHLCSQMRSRRENGQYHNGAIGPQQRILVIKANYVALLCVIYPF